MIYKEVRLFLQKKGYKYCCREFIVNDIGYTFKEKKMINHRTIRSRVISYIIASTISLIMLIGAVLLIRNSITREKDYWAGSIPIDEAIEQGYNDPDSYRPDDYPVYVEIKEAPVKID